jgi:hypothetical protein
LTNSRHLAVVIAPDVMSSFGLVGRAVARGVPENRGSSLGAKRLLTLILIVRASRR